MYENNRVAIVLLSLFGIRNNETVKMYIYKIQTGEYHY
jgi:hypothetical protein